MRDTWMQLTGDTGHFHFTVGETFDRHSSTEPIHSHGSTKRSEAGEGVLAACRANMPQRDHYEILGVRRDANPDEIKSAFKKLAATWHPDRHPNDPGAHERFKEINLAYQVLHDDNRRSMYDKFGHRAEEPGSPFGQGGPFPGGFVDISDIAVDGILGDLLGVFGVGRGDKGDIKRELELTFEEAAFGCEKSMRYERVVACSDCRGTGAASGTTPEACGACNGRGRVRF